MSVKRIVWLILSICFSLFMGLLLGGVTYLINENVMFALGIGAFVGLGFLVVMTVDLGGGK